MTSNPERGTPEWHRQHPIFKVDFSKPPSEIVESLRNDLSNIRGKLGDVRFGYPGYSERLETAQGAITTCIAYLYHLMDDMKKIERWEADRAAATKEGLGTDE